MGDNESGWWIIVAILVFLDPRVIVAGIATGLLVRRWLHVPLALFVAPAAVWLYCTLFLRTDHFLQAAPFMAVAGLLWAIVSFGAKKTWNG